MSERYTRLYSLPENLCIQGSPVIIKAGALLKDNTSDKLVAQLKFQNISDKKIKYLKAAVIVKDSLGRTLGDEITKEYLDLNISSYEEFGTREPIFIKNSSVRVYSAYVMDVGFDDNTVWSGSETDWKSLSEQEPVLAVINDCGIKEHIYNQGCSAMRNADYKMAKTFFESIREYKDANAKIVACERMTEELNDKKADSKRDRKFFLFKLIPTVMIFLLALLDYICAVALGPAYYNWMGYNYYFCYAIIILGIIVTIISFVEISSHLELHKTLSKANKILYFIIPLVFIAAQIIFNASESSSWMLLDYSTRNFGDGDEYPIVYYLLIVILSASTIIVSLLLYVFNKKTTQKNKIDAHALACLLICVAAVITLAVSIITIPNRLYRYAEGWGDKVHAENMYEIIDRNYW